MASLQNSFNYGDTQIRDVDPLFMTVVQDNPVLANLLNAPTLGPAMATKYEWQNDVIGPTKTTLTAAYTAGDGSLTVASEDGFQVGGIVQIKKADRTTGFRAKVTAVAANTLTITVVAGDTDENLLVGAFVELISNTKPENSTNGIIDQQQPTFDMNYTQIFREDYGVSGTTQAVGLYGINDPRNQQVMNYHGANALRKIMFQVERSVTVGFGEERSGSSNGSMKGVITMQQEGTAKTDLLGAALTEAAINTAISDAVINGATGINVMLASPKMVELVSSLVTANKRVNAEQPAVVIGGQYVPQYLTSNGTLLSLVASNYMPEDKASFLDTSMIEWVPLQGRTFADQDSTQPGQDGETRYILGEYTLAMKNKSQSHFLLEGIAPAS